jgi:replicative DNA helicase
MSTARYEGDMKEADSKHKGGVLFFSLEMSAEELAQRLISDRISIPVDRIVSGRISNHDLGQAIEARREIARLPLIIDDSAVMTISTMRMRCRKIKRTQGLSLVIVDYLQLVTAPTNQKTFGRVGEVDAVVNGLKALAKELDVPVVALSQLSRRVEDRDDKRPTLADLRESGGLEQAADLVLLLYRDEYYRANERPQRESFKTMEAFSAAVGEWQRKMDAGRGKAEIIIGKFRAGAVGMVTVAFDGAFTRFSDLAQERFEV